MKYDHVRLAQNLFNAYQTAGFLNAAENVMEIYRSLQSIEEYNFIMRSLEKRPASVRASAW
jgi:O-acetylhomoserine/O-acetylserine sulfhydrylase-like pyridoxal-dependent enzyme